MPHTNQAGVDLIKRFEGCRLQAYRDVVGVLTIGYGHTGPDVHEGQAITQAHADELLRRDLERFEREVQRLVTVELTRNQFAALVSFTYNLGSGALARSTLLRKVNAGEFGAAANEFRKWVRAGGRVLSGLVRRREAERKLFLQTEG